MDSPFSTDSSPGLPVNRSLFAGATPAAKSTAKSKSGLSGGGTLFGANGKPTASLPPVFKGFGTATTGQGFQKPRPSRVSPQRELNMFSSPSNAGDDSIVYEGEQDDESTVEDMEEDDTGMYGDEEDLDDTLRDDPSGMDEGEYDEEQAGPLQEPGTLISDTEKLLGELHGQLAPHPQDDDDRFSDDSMDMNQDIPLEEKQQIVTKTAKDFLQLLQRHLPPQDQYPGGNDLYDAYYLASLVLPLQQSTANTTETIRKWLYLHHPNPEPRELNSFKAFHPQYVLSPDFWDMVQRLVLRGELQEVIEILQNANWDLFSADAPALTRPAFGAGAARTDKHWSAEEISATKEAVHNAVRFLSACPGKGRSAYQPSSTLFPPLNMRVDSPGTAAEWRLWHGTAVRHLEELKGLSSSADDDEETEDSYYGAIGRTGAGSFGFGLPTGRSARPKLPLEVSRGLRFIYETVQGDHDVLLASSSNWQEAIVALMMWGRDVDNVEPEDEEYEEAIFDLDPQSTEYTAMMMQRRVRELDRLAAVTDEVLMGDFPMDTTSSLDVGVAGILSGDPAYLRELASFSLLVTSAVIEIGGWGTWVPRAEPKDSKKKNRLLNVFEPNELAVLQSAPQEPDEHAQLAESLLRRYAAALFETEYVEREHDMEGWEIAVGVLARAPDAADFAAKLLQKLELSSSSRVQKLLTHCDEAGLASCRSDIAFRWAQQLRESEDTAAGELEYGEILKHLALATEHPDARAEMHELVNALMIRSLMDGRAYPDDIALDATLAEYLRSPEVVQSDVLRFEMSGYATLRNYYATKEQDPVAATRSLVAVLRSAGECIDGGVWDTEWEAPVEPRVIPGLLRELRTATEWMDERMCVDTAKVITDFESAGEGVWKETEAAWEETWWQQGGLKGEIRKVREDICRVLARVWVGSL